MPHNSKTWLSISLWAFLTLHFHLLIVPNQYVIATLNSFGSQLSFAFHSVFNLNFMHLYKFEILFLHYFLYPFLLLIISFHVLLEPLKSTFSIQNSFLWSNHIWQLLYTMIHKLQVDVLYLFLLAKKSCQLPFH